MTKIQTFLPEFASEVPRMFSRPEAALASCFPPLFLREAKYVPLPQRARETGPSASSIRPGASGRAAPPPSRHLPPSCSSPKPSSDRSSPMSVRTACSPSQSRSSPPAASSPPHTNHVLPHSRSHPQALTDTTRSSVNGGTKLLCVSSSSLLWSHHALTSMFDRLLQFHPECLRNPFRDSRATERCGARTPSPRLQVPHTHTHAHMHTYTRTRTHAHKS